jgi:hypothetical protein
MANYIVQLNVTVYDVNEDDEFFHEETENWLLETGQVEDMEVQTITEF